MKNSLTNFVIILCAIAITIGLMSCESEYSKESNDLIKKYEVALSEQNLKESKRLSYALEYRKLNSTQTEKVKNLNENLSKWEMQIKKEREEEERKKVDPYMEQGWIFLLTRLKSPSTASLISYMPPTENATRGIASELNMSGLEIAVFNVDAQNSFGAMLRSRYYVFYRDGIPKVVMDGDDFESYIVQFNGPNLVKGALSYAGYYD